MKWIIIIVGLLFVQTTVLVVAQRTEDDDSNDDDDKCIPKLADTCFLDVYTNLDCHFNPRASACVKKNVADLCSAIDDGLKCAGDIIDTDCTISDGRNKFDAWLDGLKAVDSVLCSDNEPLIQVLVKNNTCWNIVNFINCVKYKTQISHIADLLLRDLDTPTCFSFLVAMVTCNVQATNQVSSCLLPQDVISESIHTFFSQTGCSTSCYKSDGANTTTNKITFRQSVIYYVIFVYSILLQKSYFTNI